MIPESLSPINSSNSPHRPGFTLIELLLVIAIIGVLIAMLLPSLRGARVMANDVKCLSNLKGIGTAMYAYLPDHGDRFFEALSPYSACGGGDCMDRFRWGGRESGNEGGAYFNHPNFQPRPLNEYLSHDPTSIEGVVACPDDRGRYETSWTPTVKQFSGTSYAFNAVGKQWVDGSGTKVTEGGIVGWSLDTLLNTTTTVMFCEDPLQYESDPGWHEFVLGQGNIVFLDGHADMVSGVTSPVGEGYTFLPQ